MSDTDDKQHQATSKRLTEMRGQGNVLRSKDLAGTVVLLAGVSLLFYLSTGFQARMTENFTLSFNTIRDVGIKNISILPITKMLAVTSFSLILPIMVAMLCVVFLTPFIFGGWNFTLGVFRFKPEKFNPVANLSRLFAPLNALTQVAKSMIKAFFITSTLIYYFFSKDKLIFSLVKYPSKVGILAAYQIISNFVILLCMSVIVLALCDAMYSHYKFVKQSKMSSHEVKDEHKEADGNVEVKRKLRSKQIALLKQRLSILVPQATVVVTNPTHYAVALRYDDRKDSAPRVLAKGKDLSAQQIRHLAIAHGIPIYEAPPLARAIFHTTKIGHEIHPELYMAVAIILSYVHQLKNYQLGKAQLPKYVSEFDLPKEFIYNE